MQRSVYTLERPYRPLIAHVIFRLDTGGLENGLVNLINETAGEFRHSIICITNATAFRSRICVPDVRVIELHKHPGRELDVYRRYWRAIRALQPDIVHTRNANALEFQALSLLAGVAVRIHGEHGWDVHDLHGRSRKYRWLRKLLRPAVHRYTAVSDDLALYLNRAIGIPRDRISVIRNGVDTGRFRPREAARLPKGERPAGARLVVGTVGRMQEVKNHKLLVRAFVEVLRLRPDTRPRIFLTIVGNGPLRDQLIGMLSSADVANMYSLPGESKHVDEVLREMDVFVLPSTNEGISNTLLEAMATGLPVIATRVGGNPEVVVDGVTGILVEPEDVAAMAAALIACIDDATLRADYGARGRSVVEEHFSLTAMVQNYVSVYQACLR